MNQNFKKILFTFFLVSALGSIGLFSEQLNNVFAQIDKLGQQLAAVILNHNFKSIDQIKARYNNKVVTSSNAVSTTNKVRILLVPGHEPNYGGAEYSDYKERELDMKLALDLKQLLQNNPNYEIFITRDEKNWTPEFENYFKTKANDIIDWKKASHEETASLIASGTLVKTKPKVFHKNAPADVANRLWGINKWANEHDIDIALHLHFNDYPRSRANNPGEYSGFSIYVPANHYGNSTTTKAIADNIFKRLVKYNPSSDLTGESEGIIDEQDLIAIGVDNSSNAASLLIEYGYIYEPQLSKPNLRDMAIKDLAYQTYLGLQDFFEPADQQLVKARDTMLLPYDWKPLASKEKGREGDIFALQTALIFDGSYPPANKSKNDCPRTGVFGPCTQSALDAFKNKHGIKEDNVIMGEETVNLLKKFY